MCSYGAAPPWCDEGSRVAYGERGEAKLDCLMGNGTLLRVRALLLLLLLLSLVILIFPLIGARKAGLYGLCLIFLLGHRHGIYAVKKEKNKKSKKKKRNTPT